MAVHECLHEVDCYFVVSEKFRETLREFSLLAETIGKIEEGDAHEKVGSFLGDVAIELFEVKILFGPGALAFENL